MSETREAKNQTDATENAAPNASQSISAEAGAGKSQTSSSKNSSPSASTSASPWAPFGRQTFLVLWLATVVSNVGTWMHDVGAGWLMTELSPSPFVVALVQAATTAPVFLFALLAGALADTLDRRMLLLVVNTLMAAAAAALAALVALDLMTPGLLILFTFLLGTGAAFGAPAWQAIVPKLVPREELPAAIALNSMGVNVSRAIGPALAGALIVALGLSSPFALNALSFVGIIAALYWWRIPETPAPRTPPEHVGEAMLAGLRYAFNSEAMRSTLLRAAAFFLFASAYWAMLPLIARTVLQGGPTLYGVLLAAVGAGAVGGALLLPQIRKRLDLDGTVVAGAAGTAIVLLLFAVAPSQSVAVVASALGGLSWIAVLSSLHVSAQTSLPDWVRARGLSVFLTVFFGSMALGSLVWGQVANLFSVQTALIVASIGMGVSIVATRWARLTQGAAEDLAPAMHWPAPDLANTWNVEEEADATPVMIQIVYRVRAAEKAEFRALMAKLRRSRQRGGGYRWMLTQDAADPERFVENWVEGSWRRHLRHHDRVSAADQALQETIRALQIDKAQPVVAHLLAMDVTATPPKTSSVE